MQQPQSPKFYLTESCNTPTEVVTVKMVYIILGVVLLVFLIGTGSAATNPNLKEVREKHEKSLFIIDGVAGVYDDPTTQEIVVMVERPEHIKKIPEKLDGYRVKVEVTGKIQALKSETDVISMFQPLQTGAYSRTGVNRPVFGGISVGNAKSPTSAGTLGLVVSGTDLKSYVLSNAHVLALNSQANFVPLGTEIWQPGGYDGGTSGNRIGVLSKYIPITFRSTRANNYADAAIGILEVSGLNGQVLNSDNTNFYTISGTAIVQSGDTVRKSGRTTGVTTADVTNPSASVKVYYTNTKWAIFKDQILTGSFSSAGDSGSAVDKNNQFVGLLYAGSSTISVTCKAQYILGPLGITV